MLLKNEKGILRVLMQRDDTSLVIDCIKRTMPKWVLADSLASYEGCSDAELYERTAMPLDRQLTEEDKRIAQEHYSMIAGVPLGLECWIAPSAISIWWTMLDRLLEGPL